MDTSKRIIESEKYNHEPVIAGNKNVWFLNKELVRVHHYNRSNGLISLYNIIQDRIETCLISDFKRNREKAYTVGETAKLVNRHKNICQD